jgi:hypothetical protein
MKLKNLKTFSAAIASCAILLAATGASAATIAQWTFEPGTAGNPPLAASTTSITGIAPATGSGTASGLHASAATTFDNPSGNGSVESFSSNNWAIGDYYQFQTSTAGSSGISLTFDATGSNTGPRDFKIQYSTDGSTFTDSGFTYAVLSTASPNASWSSGTNQPAFTNTFDFSAVTALDNQAAVYFRLVNTSNVSINNGTVGTGGTQRLDNVTISDTVIPEPTAFALGAIGLACVAAFRRRT